MYFDILVVLPLEEEFLEFIDVFPVIENLTEPPQVMYSVQAPNNVSMVAILQTEMGYWGATNACNVAFGEHHFGIVVCLGIAGGLHADVKIGDVCYSGTIIDTYANGKIRDSETGGEDVDLASEFLPTPKHLSGIFSFQRVMPEFRPKYTRWQTMRKTFAESLQDENASNESLSRLPESYPGDIVCGLVSESASYKKKLKAIQRKVLAVETESGPIARTCAAKSIPMIAIRGISDLADTAKKKLEEESKGTARKIAAANAVSFFKLQMENTYLIEYIQERRPVSTPMASLFPAETVIVSENALAGALKSVFDVATANLKEKNQAYRTLPDGALLPLPRVRSKSAKSSTPKEISVPVEIKQCVNDHRRVLLSIPRVFPDKSLPWLIAQNLCYDVVGEKQLVPVVIDGAGIRPPRGALQKLSSLAFDEISDQGGEILFIIDGFSPSSKTNTRFLADQMDQHPEARFLLLSNDDPQIKEIDDIFTATACEHYQITDISFAEISTFLSKHFAMPCDQAEVLALQLRKIFKRFRLNAHPTFFAGIPQELLASILNANKRGELIQLAVDGYLTFVVLEDAGAARLSRSTRADFLKLFAKMKTIEKRKFDELSLQHLCKKVFDEKGFPTDPKEFLDGFFKKGILTLEGENVVFGLSFMEAYFVAKNLCDDPESALVYFSLDEDDFDRLSFDLYVEMCAHPRIVEKFLTELCGLVPANLDWENSAKLCSNDIRPAMLKHNGQVRALERRIEIATEAVVQGVEERSEKQRLLDLAERVNEEISGAKRDKEDDVETDEEKFLNRGLKIWALSVILLGQGSERINNVSKEKLAQAVVSVGAHLLDRWTIYVHQTDYVTMKAALTQPDNLSRLFEDGIDLPSTLKPEEVVSAFIDMFEMYALSEPLRSVLSHISDEARHEVLEPAISAIRPNGALSRLILACWLTDVSVSKGKQKLNEMVKSFPVARFLRVATVGHYLMQVYWSMADKAARLQLLDTANVLLKPLDRELPIGEIKRQIESSIKEQRQQTIDDDL